MDITQFSPDDSDTVADVVTMLNAATDVDCPEAVRDTPAAYAGQIRHGWDGEVPETYAACDADGRVIGLVEIETSEWDNTDLAWLAVTVHPEARRRGVGSSLLDFAQNRALALGRHIIGGGGWDRPAVHAFAAVHGYEAKLVEVARRHELDRVDHQVVEKLHREALDAAADYELIRLRDRTPDDLLDALVELTAAINDAPTGGLDIEDEVYTRERVAAFETSMLGRDRRLYRVLARQRATGELAGHTVMTVEIERPEIGFQQDTSVVRSHRGHRLGMALKTDMVRWLSEAEPQLRTADTWNAESNDHMIAVNEALGYHVIGRTLAFQRRFG